MNMNSALGKGTKTLLWVGLTAGALAILSQVSARPELFSPQAVVVANTLLVLLKNVMDRDVPNV
jgi:hypothetical protein